MSVLRCVIIDDDDFSIKVLEKMIERTDFLDFVSSYENPVKAIENIKEDDPDIIFLDVEMPEMTGFDFISAVGTEKNIIMTTSSEKYAIESYDYDIVDFLLKPIIEYSRFLKSVLKVKEKLDSSQPDNSIFTNKETDSIFIKQDSVFTRVLFDHILWIEAYGDYIKIKTRESLSTVYSTLSGVEKKLPLAKFVRVHRSFIVNIEMIEKIDQNALQIGNESIPIGNSYRKKLLSTINLL